MTPIARLMETSRQYLGSPGERQLEARLTRNRGERIAAQKLRKDVFATELPFNSLAFQTLDEDEFDDHCRHLIVIDHACDQIVGTYRILDPDAARRIGRYYSEGEFDLTPLAGIRDGLLELGRSCVHPNYRDGTVIRMLWSALGLLLQDSPARYVIGCPSVSAADGGHLAAALYRSLSRRHLCEPAWQVSPRQRLAYESLYAECDPVVPPLFKGYLRAGARLMGEPHCDTAFGTVDFLMMLPVSDASGRYARKFLGAEKVRQDEAALA